MRIERIEIEGRPGHGATIRAADGQICAELARTRATRTCSADDPEAVRRLAHTLHRSLEGYEGTAGDVAAYLVILQHFAD